MSGKHKRDRAAEHKAKLDAKQRDLGSPVFNNSPGAEAYTWRNQDAGSIIEDIAALARTIDAPRLPNVALIAPRRSKRMGFVGVGTLRLGDRVLDRAMVSDAHFKSVQCRDARAIGNRHDFKRWVRNGLAPVVRCAHDSAAEMAAAGVTLEEHTIALYNTGDIARRRELEMFIAEATAARASARRRTLAALLEVVTLDVAIAWSRPAETLGEQVRRRNQDARKWVAYPRSTVIRACSRSTPSGS